MGELREGQMLITVTDPQKREQSTMFGIKSEWPLMLLSLRLRLRLVC